MLTVVTEKIEIEAGDVIVCLIPYPWSEFHRDPYRKYVVLKVYTNKTFLLAGDDCFVPYPRPSAPHKYCVKGDHLVFLSVKDTKEPELIKQIEKGAAKELAERYETNIKTLKKLEKEVKATNQEEFYLELRDKVDKLMEVRGYAIR